MGATHGHQGRKWCRGGHTRLPLPPLHSKMELRRGYFVTALPRVPSEPPPALGASRTTRQEKVDRGSSPPPPLTSANMQGKRSCKMSQGVTLTSHSSLLPAQECGKQALTERLQCPWCQGSWCMQTHEAEAHRKAHSHRSQGGPRDLCWPNSRSGLRPQKNQDRNILRK